MSPHPLAASRPRAALRRFLGIASLLASVFASTSSARADVTLDAIATTWVYGGAVVDAPNNHVRTDPSNATRDVIKFDNVNFGTGYDTIEIELRLGYGSGGQRIDVRADSSTGSVIGTLHADATGNNGSDYLVQTGPLGASVTGTHHLYLTIDDTSGLGPIRLRTVTLKNRGPLSGFLKQNGIYIRNNHGQGDIVRLYGVNLGGWSIQEPWMSPLAFGSSTPGSQRDQKGAIDILTSRLGAASAKTILDTFYDNYITTDDLDKIRAENINCIRLPIYWQDYMDASGNFYLYNGQIDFRRIEAVVEEAKKRGIYVIIDLHGVQGSQNGRDHSGDLTSTGNGDFWTNSSYRGRAKSLWREIARRFRSEPAVAGYDVLNEAAKDSSLKAWDSDIRDFVTDLYNVIREVDPDHIVFFDVWSEYYDVGTLTSGKSNIVLSYHWYIYGSFSGTEADFWNQRIGEYSVSSRETYPVPVWVGEFSFKDTSSSSSWGDRMKYMTRHGLSWTKWSYKVRGGDGWGLYEANWNNEGNRLYVDSAGVNTLTDKADNWSTATYFTKNTTVSNSIQNAIALFGAPARPPVGGPLFGLTKDMPCTLNGVTAGSTGWSNFSPNDHVAIPAVDFGGSSDRFFATLNVDATLGAGESGGVLEVRLGTTTGTLLGSVTLDATGVTSASLQRRPVGQQNIVLVAKRPGGGTANIGLIKRVFFTEPPVVSLLNKSSLKYGSVQSADSTLSTTASAAGDREDYFLLTTAADPLGSSSFTTALLSRKTMKWLAVDSANDNVLKATTAYDNSSGAPTISSQRAAAPQFVVATTGDASYRSIKANSNNLNVQAQGGDGPMKAKHSGTVGSYEKFEFVPHDH